MSAGVDWDVVAHVEALDASLRDRRRPGGRARQAGLRLSHGGATERRHPAMVVELIRRGPRR